MPKIDNVGFSDATETKHHNLREIIKIHLNICNQIYSKYKTYAEDCYYYFDITAGTGINPKNGNFGSPLIFIEEAQKFKNLNFKAFFIEKERKNCYLLKENIEKRFSNLNPSFWYKIGCGCATEILPKFFINNKKKRYGLLFADPNGIRFEGTKGITPFDLLKDMSKIKCYSNLDFLINFNLATFRRLRGVNKKGFEKYKIPIKNQMNLIDKKYWTLRDAVGVKPYIWNMMLATNWEMMANKFNKLGFFKDNSVEGKRIINFINKKVDKEKPINKEKEKIYKPAKLIEKNLKRKTIKIPEYLYGEIKAKAKQENKTINNFIVESLKKTI